MEATEERPPPSLLIVSPDPPRRFARGVRADTPRGYPFGVGQLSLYDKSYDLEHQAPEPRHAEPCRCTRPIGFVEMITFAAWTGVRQGELFALQWEDVTENEISISRSRKLDGSLGAPKNGQSRTVPLLPPARVLDDVPRRPDPFVFHSPQGKPLIKGTHAWSWQKVKAAARVECRWHDLRHFCATQLLELGVDHFAVPIQLGHTDGGALVMERYGHPSVDAAKQRLLRAFQWTEAETGSAAGSRRAET
jgi:integrase-like protein